MDFVVSGVISQVMQPRTGVSQRSGNQWMSQEFVLTYEQGQYPKSLCFRVFGQEKLQQFAIHHGDTLTVHLNITCQQSQQGTYFNSIDCWKVDRLQAAQSAQGGYQQQMPPSQPQNAPQQPQYAPQQPQMPQGGQMPFPPAQ